MIDAMYNFMSMWGAFITATLYLIFMTVAMFGASKMHKEHNKLNDDYIILLATYTGLQEHYQKTTEKVIVLEKQIQERNREIKSLHKEQSHWVRKYNDVNKEFVKCQAGYFELEALYNEKRS